LRAGVILPRDGAGIGAAGGRPPRIRACGRRGEVGAVDAASSAAWPTSLPENPVESFVNARFKRRAAGAYPAIQAFLKAADL